MTFAVSSILYASDLKSVSKLVSHVAGWSVLLTLNDDDDSFEISKSNKLMRDIFI